MRVGFVVPRYGAEVIGGSENAARMLAEKLVASGSADVEVFTTCGLDLTWADSYPPGVEEVNGVTVHRFASGARSDDFATFPDNPVRWPLEQATIEQCDNWCTKQGPVCPEVIDAAESSSCDAVAFYPYLYYPTVHGVPRLRGRAVLHPAAHDEREIRLPIFRGVFESAAGIVYHTDGERALVLDLFPVAQTPQIVLGLGIDPHTPDQVAAEGDLGFPLQDTRYLCCIGRVDNAKGTTRLGEYFIEYKRRHPGDLKLVFIGSIVDPPPPHPDIVLTGPVSEGSKWAMLASSCGLVSPSPNESFSLVVLEAWHAGVPVLVNGECAATREHCERSGGGLWFGGEDSSDPFAEFEQAVALFATKSARSMVRAGKSYAESRFTWQIVLERYLGFLEGVVSRSRRSPIVT